MKDTKAALDMKAALGNRSKPDLTHVRGGIETYLSRACEYGSDKYERGNFLRPSAENPTLKDDFERLRGYLGSVKRHLTKQLKSMESHLALDPLLQDVEGMRAAAYAPDTDAGNDKVGPSNLPHLAHLAAGLMMALEQAIDATLIPEDPGQTWVKNQLAPLAENIETHGPKGVTVECNVPPASESNTGWNPNREHWKTKNETL